MNLSKCCKHSIVDVTQQQFWSQPLLSIPQLLARFNVSCFVVRCARWQKNPRD